AERPDAVPPGGPPELGEEGAPARADVAHLAIGADLAAVGRAGGEGPRVSLGDGVVRPADARGGPSGPLLDDGPGGGEVEGADVVAGDVDDVEAGGEAPVEL